MRGLVAIMLCAAIGWLGGCGYIGPPLPPALNIPQRTTDFKAVQQGSNLVVSFTIPKLTTEELPVKAEGAELAVGVVPQGEPFDPHTWAEHAEKHEITATAPGPVSTHVPLPNLAGQQVYIAIRVHYRKGRYSEWSNAVQLNLIPALAAPAAPIAENAPHGVDLKWDAAAPAGASFRILRQTVPQPEPVFLGTSPKPAYTDETSQYGIPYRYQVQTVVKTGDAEALSDPSPLSAEITTKDIFPPAPPSGLTGLTGITTIELSWERSTELDFAFYRVYRTGDNGQRVRVADNVATPVFSDNKVEKGKTYKYQVTAVDRNNNESEPSAVVEQTAP